MMPPEGWHLPADLLARVARYKARKPRPAQRADFRARMLERARANYRQACAPRCPADPGEGGTNGRTTVATTVGLPPLRGRSRNRWRTPWGRVRRPGWRLYGPRPNGCDNP